jgi:hypothetical protein
MNSMADTHPDGTLPTGPLHAEHLEQQGYQPCRNQLCDHMIAPQVLQNAWDTHGKDAEHDCTHCGLTQQLHRKPGTPGGGTNSGLSMEEQSQIGEDLVQSLGTLPGYGQIIWWQSGPAAGSNSPLDGLTPEWGIEVKTYNWTNVRKRGIIAPKDKGAKARAVNDPNLFAKEREDPELDAVLHHIQGGRLRGLLGILVLLDFETGLADIFAHQMEEPQGGQLQPSHIKHITRQVVLAEGVPFTHSLPDPRQEGWTPHHLQQQGGSDAITEF